LAAIDEAGTARIEPDPIWLGGPWRGQGPESIGSGHVGIEVAIAVQVGQADIQIVAVADGLQAGPEVRVAVVEPDLGRSPVVGHEGIQVTVTVQIAQRNGGRDCLAEPLSAVDKLACAGVEPDPVGLSDGGRARQCAHGHEGVEVAVPIQVAEG
jgi:hypothetical protein